MITTEEYKIAKPWIRTVIAFILYLVRKEDKGTPISTAMAYVRADGFIERLEQGIEGVEK